MGPDGCCTGYSTVDPNRQPKQKSNYDLCLMAFVIKFERTTLQGKPNNILFFVSVYIGNATFLPLTSSERRPRGEKFPKFKLKMQTFLTEKKHVTQKTS